MYTQCPQCRTIYEIDEDALQASLGIVRCGHCEERFDALRTLCDTLPQDPGAMLPEHDPVELTPTLTAAVKPDALEAAAGAQRGRTGAAVPAQPDAPPGDTPSTARSDEEWFPALSGERASALIADAAGIPPETIQGDPAWQVTETPVQIRFAGLDVVPLAEPEDTPPQALPFTADAPGETAASEPFTGSWALDLAEDVTNAPDTGEQHDDDIMPVDASVEANATTPLADAETETAPVPETFEPGLPDDSALALDVDDSDEIEPLETWDERSDGDADATASTQSVAESVPTEPVYVPPRRHRIRRSDWLWALGCLLLALALAAQIGWAQRAALVRDPATQAWALRVCANIDCRLPLIRDTAKLELLSRDVRPDPATAGALMITATLRNDAVFRQPWPVVVVELTDLDNDVVAMRRFRAPEYMPDPARRAAGIAPGTTAAVAFEVADPGKRAVSFRFGFE